MLMRSEQTIHSAMPHAPELRFLWKEALVILFCLVVLRLGGTLGGIFIGIALAVWV